MSASLQIFDVTGKPVKVIKLDNGSSNVVEVSRSELGYGTFIYTLFVDGKKADTLKKYEVCNLKELKIEITES